MAKRKTILGIPKHGQQTSCALSAPLGCSAFFRTKYRIVKDCYAGYEAQFKLWWFPFWMQCDFCNTSGTVEQARKICDLHSRCGLVEEYLPNPRHHDGAAPAPSVDGVVGETNQKEKS